jgi:hypothetical protein
MEQFKASLIFKGLLFGFTCWWIYETLTTKDCNYFGGGFTVLFVETLCHVGGVPLALLLPVAACIYIMKDIAQEIQNKKKG